MKFGPVPLAQAAGAILAHSVRTATGRLRKGMTLRPSDLETLRQVGLTMVTVAVPEPGDIDENTAATRVGAILRAPGLEMREAFTGRANIHATGPGLLAVSGAKVDALNAVDPGVTVATLPEWQRVAAGTMVATVKIIPYMVDEAAVGPRLEALRGALALHPPVISQAELIVTTLDGAPRRIARRDRPAGPAGRRLHRDGGDA